MNITPEDLPQPVPVPALVLADPFPTDADRNALVFNVKAVGWAGSENAMATGANQSAQSAHDNASVARELAGVAITAASTATSQADAAMGYCNAAGNHATTATTKAAEAVAAAGQAVPAAVQAIAAAQQAAEAAERLGDGWIARFNGKGPDAQGDVQFTAADLGVYAAHLSAYTVVNASTSATPGGCYACDTTAGPITVTLPADPQPNTVVRFLDVGGRLQFNNLTVARNGQLIMGLAEDLVCSTDHLSFVLVFIAGNWRIA